MPEGNRYRQLLRNLAQLRTMGQPPSPEVAAPPPAPPSGGGQDIFLPPEGALDPRLPVAHLPPQQQQQAVQDMGGGSSASPALTEAMKVLSGNQGPIGDLVKDPAMHGHLRSVLEAVKQDPNALRALAQKGIGADKIQQFEQALQPQGPSPSPAGAPSPSNWLTGSP